MSSSTQMAQEQFIAGLKHCVEVASDSPDAVVSIRMRPVALRLLLFTGSLDGDLDRVNYALDNGADASSCLTDRDAVILTNLGWVFPNLSLLGASDESLSLSESSSEAYPCG